MRSPHGSVTIDLQAAQSPHYRERGIARYATDYTKSVVRAAPELFAQVLLNQGLPLIEQLDDFEREVKISTEPDWAGRNGIFHALSPFELDIPVVQLWPRQASRKGMRLIVTLYDLIPERFPEVYLQDPGQRRRYRARRELVRAADHVVTLSKSAADDAVSLLGVAPERITVVGAAPSVIFTPPADRARSYERARRRIPGLAERFIVYNGAVEPRKNMEALLEAFALLPPQVRADRQLVLVCRLKPEERNHYQVRAEKLDVSSQLLLTGYLSDEDLVALYQTAELVVYPSLYEGYGLPVAEALACGAPVIASNTSSLPELVAPNATFDPRTPTSIAKAVERALGDAALRHDLVQWASGHRQSWEDVATAAVQVYRDVLAQPVSSRWRTRPKVAFVSPWPPSRTGVADYSERLVAELEDLVDVDLFVDGDLADRQEELPAARSLPANDRAIGGYDETVLTVGNSEFHAGALKALRVDRIDAVVQAHDARLSGLYFHGEARGAVPEGFRAALGRLYPDLRVEIEKSDDPRLVAEKHGALMAREVVALARDVLATSDEAAEMIRRDCAPADRDKVSVWQYAYPPPVERDEDGVDEGLVCSFGLVNPLKASDTVIEAFAYLASRHRNARLAFVGPISETLRDELGGRAESLGIDADVVFTGDISDDEYREWLRRAAAAIQLRTASNGETSGAVADCLAYGIPVVVTALGPQAGLPAFVPKVPAGCTPEKLAEVVDGLLRDPDGRQKFGAESREFVACRSFRHVAEWFVGRLDF